MIAGECECEQWCDLDPARSSDGALDDRPGSKDRNLRRIEHGYELLNGEGAEIGYGESAAL